MQDFNRARARVEEVFVVILLGSLVSLVFLAAVLRWVGISIVWSMDTAQLLLTWLCFIGADLAYAKNRHVGIDFLKNALKDNSKWLSILVDLIVLAFVVSILVFGTKLCITNYARKFNTLPISYSCATVSAPVGAFLMILTGIEKLKNNIMALFVGKGQQAERRKQ